MEVGTEDLKELKIIPAIVLNWNNLQIRINKVNFKQLGCGLMVRFMKI